MAWERRGSGGRFYYRSRRAADGRVVKEYVGRGPRAEQAARDDAEARSRRGADVQSVLDEQALLARPDALTTDLSAAAGLLAEAALLAAGYHRPNYGPWRRRRGH